MITDSGHGGRRRHDHEVRDDGGAEAREHDKAGDSPVDLRPGTTVERRKIADLVPSPWQSQYYDDLSDFDLKALASDIKQHRLRDPVEILPENGAGLPTNMVLDGCQRLAALRRNGETEVIVRVRHDLASADAATIEREFLTPNRNRRQLDPLAKARIELRLFELDKGRRQEKFFARDEAEASDRVA